MTYEEFSGLLATRPDPIILLEGTRDLPEGRAAVLTRMAIHLAKAFPHARFRTGNATGSDSAFAEGVAQVDAARLEFVLPYDGHRSRYRPAESAASSLDGLSSDRVRDLTSATLDASPKYGSMVREYPEGIRDPRRRSAAQLILRDTLKVTGNGTDTADIPVAGLFHVNEEDPDKGGTGHTMRVCRAQGVPVIPQSAWMGWAFPSS